MSRQNLRIFIGIVVVGGLVLALFYRPRGPIQVDSGYRPVMGTFAHVIAVAPNSRAANRAIEAAFKQLEAVDALMSNYKTDSEINHLNRSAFKEAVKVSASTYEVLKRSLAFGRLTDGAFDITVGPLAELWHSAAEANSLPTDAELQQVRRRVGYEKLILDDSERSVRFAVDGMKLDLGGIAKGFAIDKAVEVMLKAGAIGGLIDVGGDIRCFGLPSGKEYWRVGLQDPNDSGDLIVGGDSLFVLKLTDGAVATSGDYRRFSTIQGKRYSHILNRQTSSASRGLTSVTIIAPNATDADALATAVSVIGAEKGFALIEKLSQTEAIMIPSQWPYEFIKTAGAGKYID